MIQCKVTKSHPLEYLAFLQSLGGVANAPIPISGGQKCAGVGGVNAGNKEGLYFGLNKIQQTFRRLWREKHGLAQSVSAESLRLTLTGCRIVKGTL